jgi:hypothetical protein
VALDGATKAAVGGADAGGEDDCGPAARSLPQPDRAASDWIMQRTIKEREMSIKFLSTLGSENATITKGYGIEGKKRHALQKMPLPAIQSAAALLEMRRYGRKAGSALRNPRIKTMPIGVLA